MQSLLVLLTRWGGLAASSETCNICVVAQFSFKMVGKHDQFRERLYKQNYARNQASREPKDATLHLAADTKRRD
jgi:hypothetical protein